MIDLHTHTTASDGTTSPGRLMEEARAAGIAVLGLTDHDTVAGWDEAAARVQDTGVALVRGMEASARVRGISAHILGYLFDPEHPGVRRHVERLFAARRDRARQIVERIGRDHPIAWERVLAAAGSGVPVGRPHIADALVASGVAADRAEAFDRFLRPGNPYHVPHYAPHAVEVVEWITAAGGKAVFAHPRASKRGRIVALRDIEELVEAGLFGLEIDHRDNTDADGLVELAARRGLVRTGSSDYHGSGKPNRLGENTTSPEVADALTSGSFLEVLYP